MYDGTKIIGNGANADPQAGPGADMPLEAMQEVENNG